MNVQLAGLRMLSGVWLRDPITLEDVSFAPHMDSPSCGNCFCVLVHCTFRYLLVRGHTACLLISGGKTDESDGKIADWYRDNRV
jgi:hypothetical protein